MDGCCKDDANETGGCCCGASPTTAFEGCCATQQA